MVKAYILCCDEISFQKAWFSRGSFLYHWDMVPNILQDVCFIGKKFLRQTPPNAAKREKEVAYRFSWISNSAWILGQHLPACMSDRRAWKETYFRIKQFSLNFSLLLQKEPMCQLCSESLLNVVSQNMRKLHLLVKYWHYCLFLGIHIYEDAALKNRPCIN